MSSATRPSRPIHLLPALVLVIAPFAVDPAPTGTDQAVPPTDLTQRLLKSLEGDRDEMRHWAYVESAVLEKRSPDGTVRSRTNEVYEIYHAGGRRMKKPLSLDLADDSEGFAMVRREESRFLTPTDRSASSEGAVVAKDSPFEVEKLLRCFRFGEPARETAGGKVVLKVPYTPVDGCLDDGSRAGRLLQNLSGTIWVDERAADIVKIEGTLMRPVTFGFGLLGRIEAFGLEVDREALAQGPYAMTHVDYRARGTAFIFHRFDVTSIRDRSAFANEVDRPAPPPQPPQNGKDSGGAGGAATTSPRP